LRPDVAPREDLFQVLEKRRVDRHHVLEVAVNRAVLDHQDLAVALDHLGLDFARPLVHQDADFLLAVNHLLADLRNALGAQRIRRPRPAQLGLHLFVRFQ